MTDAAGRCRSKTVVPTGITSLSLSAPHPRGASARPASPRVANRSRARTPCPGAFRDGCGRKTPYPSAGVRRVPSANGAGGQASSALVSVGAGARSRLAGRAPEHDALARRVGAERAAADQRAAATARPALAAVDPVRAAGPRVAREGAVGAVAVGADHAGAEIDEGRGIRLVGRSRGKDAAHEQDLVRVLVAEPGDVALVLAARRGRAGRRRRAAARPRRDPSRPTSGSGPRWPTSRSSSRGRDDLDVGEVEADRLPLGRADDRAGGERRACASARRAGRRATRPPS